MIDAYEVGVSLVLDNKILQSIAAANEAMSTLTNTIMGANAALKRMGSYTQDLVSSARDLRQAWQGVAAAVNTASSRASKFGTGSASSSAVAAAGASGAAGGALPVPLPGGAGSGGRGGGGGGLLPPGFGGGALSPRGLPPINLAGSSVGGAGGSGGGGRGGGFNPGPPSHGDYAVAGMAFGAIGAAILGFAGKSIDAAGELTRQQNLMVAAGMNSQEIAEATAQAWRNTSAVMGTTASDNLKSIRELRMVFGDTADAIKYSPMLAQAHGVMGALLGGDQQDQVFGMAKALEIKGVSTDPAHFKTLLNQMIQASVASGGKVTGTDFLAAFKYGRSATQGWSDQFSTQVLPTLIQEMGGSGSGTALMSAYNTLVGGHMQNKGAAELAKLGLLKQNDIIYTTTGSVKGVKPGGVEGAGEFTQSPYEWVQDYLLPALKKDGKTSPDDIRTAIASIFGARTAQQVMDMFATQQPRFSKDASLDQQAKGLEAWNTLISGDFTTNLNAFTASITNFAISVGTPLIPVATELLHNLAIGIGDLAREAREHPGWTKFFGEVAAGLGVVAVALATVSMSIFAFGPALRVAWQIGSVALPLLGRVLGVVMDVVLGVAGLATGLDEVAAAILGVGLAIAALNKWFPNLFSGSQPPADHQGQHLVHVGKWGSTWVNNNPSPSNKANENKPHETMIQEAHEAMKAIANWIGAGAPTNANVTNAGAISSATAARVMRQGNGPSTGSTGYNPRSTPSGSAAMQTHGRS